MENNEEKVRIMFDKLSDSRRKQIEGQITDAVKTLEDNNAKENVDYAIEITDKFDKEEPHQFVWIKTVISFHNSSFAVQTPQGIRPAKAAKVAVVDMEVYDSSSLDHWLDHCERIKKQDNLYYSKDGVEKKNKFDDNNLVNEIESALNEELEDETLINEQEYSFSDLFISNHPTKKSKEQYKNIFIGHARIFANRILDVKLKINPDNVNSALPSGMGFVNDALLWLTSEFELCDFTEFNKSELEMFGFVNWRNKFLMIPIWAFPIILKNNKGLKLTDINGNTFVLGKDYIDMEHRNGNMPIGFPFKIEEGEEKMEFNYEKTE